MAEEKVLKSDVVEEEIKVKKPTLFDWLHNFRNLNILYAIGGILGALANILFLLFFQLDRMYMGTVALNVNAQGALTPDGKVDTSFYADNQIFGFIVFAFAVASIVIAVLAVYNAVPYIQKKDKLSVKKAFGVMSVVSSLLCLVMIAFAIVGMVRVGVQRDIVNEQAVYYPYSGHLYFWIPLIVMLFATAVYDALVFVPILSVKVFMPEYKAKKPE